jgi:DNA-binding transcriptional ArsR family regulator
MSAFSLGETTLSPNTRSRIERGLKSLRRFDLLAETFQALGDPSRLRIVWTLSHGELSVTAVTRILGMSQPAVSHHLRMLRNLKLVKVRRSGRTIFYSLDDEHIDRLLQEGMRHVEDFL